MKSFQAQTHYEVLEISVGATVAEIRGAFERLNQLYSDEQVVLYGLIDAKRAEALRNRLKEALETLSHDDRRDAYDVKIGLPPRERPKKPVVVSQPLPPSVQTGAGASAATGWGAFSWAPPAPAIVAPASNAYTYTVSAAVAVPTIAVRPVAPEPQPSAGSVEEVPPAKSPSSPTVHIAPPASVSPSPDRRAEEDEPTPPKPARVDAREVVPEAAGAPEASPPVAAPAPSQPAPSQPAASQPVPPQPALAQPEVADARQLALDVSPGPVNTWGIRPAERPSREIVLPPADPPQTPVPEIDVPRMSDEVEVAIVPARATPAREFRIEQRAKPFDVPADVEFNGDLLRQVRMARGLSLMQLADRTRIGVKHLENVESDRYDALPVGVYLRGILMNIARELGLDGLRVSKSYLTFVEAHRSKG